VWGAIQANETLKKGFAVGCSGSVPFSFSLNFGRTITHDGYRSDIGRVSLVLPQTLISAPLKVCCAVISEFLHATLAFKSSPLTTRLRPLRPLSLCGANSISRANAHMVYGWNTSTLHYFLSLYTSARVLSFVDFWRSVTLTCCEILNAKQLNTRNVVCATNPTHANMRRW